MNLLDRMVQLQEKGEPFAVATVVTRRPPVSSHLGDKAIVLSDGTMEGFVGGACSKEIVRRQALEAMATGIPRLVRIAPEFSGESTEHTAMHEPQLREIVFVPMTCASEGAVDLYIEPYVLPPVLAVAGGSPIARALVENGSQVGFDTVLACTTEERHALLQEEMPQNGQVIDLDGLGEWLSTFVVQRRRPLYAVAASMGHYDEEALDLFHAAKPRYLGLIASRKRADTVRQSLRQMGWTEQEVTQLDSPAGLDIGAKTQPEVALSVLALVVARRRSDPGVQVQDHAEENVETETEQRAMTLDPVCGMTVDPMTARYQAVYEGHTYYFCNFSCKMRFEEAPQRFVGETVS